MRDWVALKELRLTYHTGYINIYIYASIYIYIYRYTNIFMILMRMIGFPQYSNLDEVPKQQQR